MAEADQLESIERERARLRMLAAQNNKAGQGIAAVETFPQQEPGKTRDKVASAIGIGSGRTYDKAAQVWEAAIERERAKRRQAASSQSDNLPKTIDAVAAENKVGRATVHRAATGIGSGRTYDKAAKVWEAGENLLAEDG